MKIIWWLGLSLLGSLSFSQTEEQILFLEVRNSKGELVQLEPHFPYAHVLVSYKGNWLHSHPKSGVKVIDKTEIEEFGTPREAFWWEISTGNLEKVETWLGRPYDSSFQWSDEKFYCSELVAKILDIAPEPMHFDSKLWPPSFQELEGLPGVSPSRIYQYLKAGGFSF